MGFRRLPRVTFAVRCMATPCWALRGQSTNQIPPSNVSMGAMKRSALLWLALAAYMITVSGCAQVPSGSQQVPAPTPSASATPLPSAASDFETVRGISFDAPDTDPNRTGQLRYTPPNAGVPEAERTSPDHVICPNHEPCGP
jgi:hypothetical protein